MRKMKESDGIVVSPEMAAAGVAVLTYATTDELPSYLDRSDLVARIYRAMRHAGDSRERV